MHVIFISACQKRAIPRSRAILDSYALRAGERCWMSPMTTEGLQEVRAALARSATRQTSVACYQNDGRRRMKLLWIVGARGRFGPEGHFPAGYRRITTPVRVSEWVRHAGLAARLAGLLHDLGKYSLKFQEKLRGKAELADAVRHEWISLKLWQAVRSGMDWKTAWANVYTKRLEMFIGEREICNASRYGLASAQECVDALVSTHHGLFSSRLPCPEGRLVRKTCPARLMTRFSPRGPNLKVPFGSSRNGWTNAFPQRLWAWRVKRGFHTGDPFSCMHARLLSLRITQYRRWSARQTKILPPPSPTRMSHPMDAA